MAEDDRHSSDVKHEIGNQVLETLTREEGIDLHRIQYQPHPCILPTTRRISAVSQCDLYEVAPAAGTVDLRVSSLTLTSTPMRASDGITLRAKPDLVLP